MNKPDLRIVTVWRIRALLLAVVPSCLTTLFWRNRPRLWLGATAFWCLCVGVLYFLYYPLKYRKLSYAVRQTWLVVHCGVIYTRLKAIPLENIQFVTLLTPLLQRPFGLVTVVVQAAGGSVHIPGIEANRARALQTQLLAGVHGEEEL